MQHVVIGTILLIIPLCLVIGTILTAPKLTRVGIKRSARNSFCIVAVGLAAYLSWIATLFYHDVLGPENYTWELWVLRIGLMLACFHYVWSVWRCDK